MSTTSAAAVLELGHAKDRDAHCLACGFKMLGGADVGLCPKCGSNRWYKTRLDAVRDKAPTFQWFATVTAKRCGASGGLAFTRRLELPARDAHEAEQAMLDLMRAVWPGWTITFKTPPLKKS